MIRRLISVVHVMCVWKEMENNKKVKKLINASGVPNLFLFWAKYSSASFPWATITAVIKVMFSCKLVQKFYIKVKGMIS